MRFSPAGGDPFRRERPGPNHEPKTMKQATHPKRAFTLIELLVVMVIVSILCAILVPSLQSAKQRAKRLQCLSNIRQIGIGIEYYKEDHEQYYPFRPPTSVSWADKNVLMNVLGSNYFRASWGIFRCPANNNPLDPNLRTNSLGGRMDFEINSGVFGMNFHGTNSNGNRISLPAFCNVLFDWPPPNYWQGLGGFVPTAEMPHAAAGMNVYFADGHASWLTAEDSQKSVDGDSPHYNWGRD